jgi:DNA-binding GntR family transcriptional regulator
MALKLLTRVEQVAEYLKNEILRGRWGESMPGSLALKKQLGTSHNTIHMALTQLEAEGRFSHKERVSVAVSCGLTISLSLR